MATLAFNESNAFTATFGNGDMDADALKMALTNTAPDAADVTMSDITEITSGNGYTTGGEAVGIASSSQTGGTYTLVGSGDITWTGVTGAMATFRYIVFYDDTQTGDPIFGWYDHGSEVTLGVGDTYTFSTDGVNLISG